MALGYPYVSITGQSEEGAIEVQVSVFDEYHLADEAEILQAVSQTLAARSAITSVSATRYEVSITKIPEV